MTIRFAREPDIPALVHMSEAYNAVIARHRPGVSRRNLHRIGNYGHGEIYSTTGLA
jgi:hypothetical protein